MSREELVHRIAVQLDMPSLYMGGPSRQSRRKAEKIVDVLPDHAGATDVYAGRVHVDALSEALGDVSNDVDGFVSVAEVIAAVHNARDLS